MHETTCHISKKERIVSTFAPNRFRCLLQRRFYPHNCH